MDELRSVPRRARHAITRRAALALAACLVACGAGCAGAISHIDRPPPAAEDNSLGPGDVFAVRVFGEADMTQEYRVASDGSIDFPYIGRLRVQGLEPTQVADRLREQLLAREILRAPQVSVFVREINSRRILVMGAVARQGTFAYEQNMTIVQAISAAGGFTGAADQGVVRLLRRVRGGPQRTYLIPVDAITEGRLGNVPVAPDDMIVVPDRIM